MTRHTTDRATSALILLFLLLSSAPTSAQEGVLLEDRDVFHPAVGKRGMVVTQKAEATGIGVEILERGGNAVDAAVAVGFALAVALPRAGNLGGGGFMLVHAAGDGSEPGETIALDYRETAPRAAHRDMYLDSEGRVDADSARFSHRSVAVPGTVAGLALALERWGTLPLAEVVAPAVALAENGVLVTHYLASKLRELEGRLARWPASREIFLPGGSAPEPGEILVQKDLARSLRQIAAEGPRAFYDGAIADLLVAEMKANGGLLTRADLAGYEPVVREPVRGTYRGHEVVSMPPPSSGGVHVIQMLNILEPYPLDEWGHNSAATLHVLAEAMKLAYADRSRHLGDPAFFEVPVEGLVSKNYAASLRRRIDRQFALPSELVVPGDPQAFEMAVESPDTTHFSVVDRQGNAVANTYTLNFSYGTGIVAAGTGILLNNEMDDFSAKPGVPNAYGLVGGEANAIEAGKRPLSSMTPTIVLRDGHPYLVTGSPGGGRIISTVLQLISNVVDHGMNVAAATMASRVHHQWQPDELRIEVGLSPDTVRLLEALGHRVELHDAMGSTQSILIDDGRLYGAADPRRPDALALGF